MGFEVIEHGLDIVVDPDGVAWQWKDEDEVAYAVASGTYTAAEAAELYAEGERAVERLRRELALARAHSRYRFAVSMRRMRIAAMPWAFAAVTAGRLVQVRWKGTSIVTFESTS